MQIQVIAYILSVIIALFALGVALTTLFKTHLSKFKPIVTVGDLSIRIYPIKSDDEEWFLPSFSLPISISNDGAKPGKVLGIRLIVSFPDLPINGNKEIILPKWEVDNKIFKKMSSERFNWIEEAVIEDWMPYVVLPKNTVSKNLILETRWDEPVIQKNVNIKLEIYTNAKKEWIKINHWKFSLTPFVWGTLTSGSTFTIEPENNLPMGELIYPKDLHKYTGSKEPLPKLTDVAPSYLNYPVKDEESEKL